MPNPTSQEFVANLGRSIEQGLALHRQGKFDEAEKIYTRVLKSVPDQFETLQLMAELQLARGKAGEARNYAAAAVRVRPAAADPLVLLGHILRLLRREDEALATFEKALAIDPKHIDALGIRGDLLLARGRAEEALQSFDRILAVSPRHADARANRAAALAALGRFAEALAECEAVLAIAPGHGMALYNRGNALANLGRQADALIAFDRVLALFPQHVAAWNNRGNALSALKRPAEAVDSFASAIALRPEFADAHFNQSLALLASGDYVRGFAAYEWRWKRAGMPPRKDFGRPLWLGEFPLANKTILVHSEQGLGDTVQFARYVPMLARAGATVALEVHAELKSLLSRLDGAKTVVARGESLPPFDVQCPLGSLPLACKTELGTVPAEIPYLSANESRAGKWQPRINALKSPRVALVWAGNASHANDRNRSIAMADLKPLWEGSGASFVGLQRELRSGDIEELKNTSAILQLGDELCDLDDTAAVLAQCDLVISVDTLVAHLGAAMGRPTWVLLPFAPDWRWTLDRERSPWYPAARLFRQPQAGDWASVIARVRAEIARFCGTYG
jgi:tetratricopeptide (TPR) repeat protein